MSADFWAGYISGAVGILIGNPLDIAKVRLQSGRGESLSSSVSSSSSSLLHRTAALATGAAAPILGYGALNALLFVSYREAEAVLRPSGGLGVRDGHGGPGEGSGFLAGSPATATWLAGAFAGLATWIVSTPTELIKCRAQLAPTAGYEAVLSGPSTATTRAAATAPASSAAVSSWIIARQVWAAEGVRGFFLGGTVTALRDSIGYGFYFWSYVLATDAWRRHSSGSDGSGSSGSGGNNSQSGSNGSNGSNSHESPSATATLVCGGLAGIVTWASVFPLDVIKTRVQAQALLLPQNAASSPAATTTASSTTPLLGTTPATASMVSTAGPGTAARRLSAIEITRRAYHQGGLAVFFRGLGVCSARAFVVNAAQWTVYEWIMQKLKP